MLDVDGTAKLVSWICWFAREQDTALTTVQLVKYLYLADLYQARLTGGQTLSGWPWAFVHFGPYCSEALEAVDRSTSLGLVVRENYDSKYDDKEFRIFRPAVSTEPDFGDAVPFAVLSNLKGAIKKWADDTAGLLDHVYFETEPMQGIEPRSRLDFATARLPAPAGPTLPPLKLPERKLRKGRDILARLRARTIDAGPGTELDTGPHDDAYRASLSADEPDIGEFQGRIDLDISGLHPDDEVKG